MRTISVSVCRPLLVCIILAISFSTSFAQGFAWAQGIISPGGTGIPSVVACTTDDSNDGYFIGSFNGTTDFDPGLGIQNLTAVGDLNMFILKKDLAGNFLWVKQVAGINTSAMLCFGCAIELDSSGNIYIGGSFRGDFDFDPGPGVYQLSSYGGYHSFVLKLDSSGNFIWVKDMGNQTAAANMSMLCMKMDALANVYFGCSINGISSNTIDVDPGPAVHNIICPITGGNDVLVEKLDSAGNFVWAKQVSGTGDEDPWDLALDTSSNIYLTGQFQTIVDFDPGPGVADLTSTGMYDAFIAKYDSAGNFIWAEQISGTGDEVGKGVATDTFGNVVVTGHIGPGSANFVGAYSITSSDMDMFVLKLRSNGSFVWANSVQPGGNDRGLGITTDGQGNLYTTGDFFSSADFDPGSGEYWLSGGVYVQKLDSVGNFVWARSFEAQVPGGIALDQANDIYVLGWFSTSGDFDPGPGVFTLNGSNDGFIEKLCGSSLAISADDSTLCLGDQAQLTTPAITGATYTWTRNDTVVSTGSNNTITISTPGAYEVYVTGGCPNASGVLYVHDCTGVGEPAKATDVEAYPNPFDDVIAVKGLETGDQVYLLDITGRTLRIWQSATSTESFTTTDISPGYYVLRIVNEQRAVKENVPVVKR